MTKIYANLIGNWVCLNDDPTCVMGENQVSPSQWYQDGAEVYSPISRKKANDYCYLDYVYISYKGKDYRINPIFIQIVVE